MVEDLLVGVAAGAHDGGADLAEAHAMTPSGTAKGEGGGNAVGADVVALDGEGRAVEVALRQRAAYLQLLAYDHSTLGAHKTQTHQTS